MEGVTDEDMRRESLDYRRAKDKAGRSLEAFKFYVNALYVALTRAVLNAWLVEDDPAHPLLARLDVSFGAPVGGAVAPARSSVEEWQREARRLEQQGKLEQAEAIRTAVLHLQPVPWTVLDAEGVRQLADKALDPKGVSQKARQQLYEFAGFHEEAALARRLQQDVGFRPTEDFAAGAAQVVHRALKPYEAKHQKDLLWQTERHGVDFRTPFDLTPLMMAAAAGNLPLVEALVARGARLDARDLLGHLPLHWALRRAYADAAFARSSFGAIYDVLAPPSFDVQVEGRLVQVGREQGEYFLFHHLMAEWCLCYPARTARYTGWTVARVSRPPFEHFPEVVVRASRRKRAYLNSVLSRNEVSSNYPSSRPNPGLSLRVALPDGTEAWRPVLEVLNVRWLESHLLPSAGGRLYGAPASPATAR